MTSSYELNLDIQKWYSHTKTEVFWSRFSKVRARTIWQTDRHTHTHRTTKPII